MTDQRPSALAGARRRAPPSERIVAGFAAAAALAVLIVAASLTPSRSGFGTHERLGLNPCVWLSLTGKPCPTCGMTTAFAYAAHADLAAAFKAQPLGMALAVLTASGLWVALHVAVTGSLLGQECAGLLGRRFMWTALAALAGAWVYKIATWPPV